MTTIFLPLVLVYTLMCLSVTVSAYGYEFGSYESSIILGLFLSLFAWIVVLV